jgi:hypothetical protein
MAKFNIHIDPIWKAPMLLIGATQAKSWVDVADDELDIRMGVGHEHIPLSNVASVSPHEWSMWYGLGHRLGYDGIGYVGSTNNVVEIKLKKPQAFNLLLGIKADYGSFFVSVDDPEAFIAAVRSALARVS